MEFMLDTNICIYIIKQKPREVLDRFNECKIGDIGISSITLAELQYGASKSLHPQKNIHALNEFVAPLEIAVFEEQAAQYYGEVRALLEKRGTPIGSMDTLICAHAVSLGVTLVTNNVREFRRIKDLSLVNWAV